MNHFSDTDLVSKIIPIVKKAADKINYIRHTNFNIEIKKDSSPVTLADQVSEKIILEELKKLTPHIPIIAEEQISSGKKIHVQNEFWLVDPLDGTKGFIKKSNHFTINIGLIRNGNPVLGIVACPAYHEIFYGIIHHGAWKLSKKAEVIPLHVTPPLHEKFRILISNRCTKNPHYSEFVNLFPNSSIHEIGSTLKILWIAEGKADLHPRFSPTMEWDTAAPQAILEAAGGYVCDFNNKPLQYGKKKWKNHNFFCSSVPLSAYLNQFHSVNQ